MSHESKSHWLLSGSGHAYARTATRYIQVKSKASLKDLFLRMGEGRGYKKQFLFYFYTRATRAQIFPTPALCASSAWAPLCRASSPGCYKGPEGQLSDGSTLLMLSSRVTWASWSEVVGLLSAFFSGLERRSSPRKQNTLVTCFMDIFQALSLRDCATDQQEWARGLEGSLESRERSWRLNVNAATSQICMGRAGPCLKLCWIQTVPNSLSLTSRLFRGPLRVIYFISVLTHFGPHG